MFSKKLWFHVFSFFLVSISLFFGLVQIYKGHTMVLEFMLGSGEGEQFISSVFVLDTISNVFVLMVGSVSFLVLKYAYWYMGEDFKHNAFFITFFVFIFFMFLLSVSSSLFWVMLGWDGLGISSFCLVMFFSNWKSFNSALITFLVNRFGDFFFILSIWVYTCFFFNKNSLVFIVLGFLVLITGMTKSAQVPFSAWLPAAMAAPTPVSSLVHSSTLVTAGIFLLTRFQGFLSAYSLKLLLYSSILTVFISGLSALGENDLKKIIALSTLSHLGFMMFFISKNMIDSTMIHLLVHAFFKSLLFMAAGVVIHLNFNNQDIRKLSGLSPLLMLVLLIAIMANMGIPFLSGFYSKEILIFSMFSDQSNFSTLESVSLSFSVLFTCLYSIRIVFSLFQSENLVSCSETNSMTNFSKLNWMLFSSLFSCFMGGVVVWIIIDPCESVESSFFLKKVKLFVFAILVLSFFLVKSGLGISSFCLVMNSKMWFIYEFSKMFSKKGFDFSHWSFWKTDVKAILAKTPDLNNLVLKEEVLLKYPKKFFYFSVLSFLVFFGQTILLNKF